jgi:WD40 repeat protein
MPLRYGLLLALTVSATARAEPPEVTARADCYGDPLPPRARARLGTVRFRVDGDAVAVALSDDGRTLFSVYHYQPPDADLPRIVLSVWDAKTGRLRRPAVVLEDPQSNCGVSANGRTVAIASKGEGAEGSSVRIWDVESGREAPALAIPEAVAGMALTRDGGVLATSGKSGGIRLWDLRSRSELRRCGGKAAPQMLAFSQDGKTVAGDQSGEVYLWDTGSGRKLRQFTGGGSLPWAIAFAPTGRVLAVPGPKDDSSTDGAVRLWDPSTGKELRRIPTGTAVHALAFTPDGDTLATARRVEHSSYVGARGVVHLWDAATGRERLRLEDHLPDVRALAFSADGRLLATGAEGVLGLWDAKDGTSRVPAAGHEGAVWKVAFAPDGRTLATGSLDGSIGIWDAATGRLVRRFGSADRQRVWSIAFSPDGRALASYSHDGSVRLWDPSTGAEIRRIAGQDGPGGWVAFSPDGRTLAAGGETGSLRLRDVVSDKERAVFSDPAGQLFFAGFSPDGKLLARLRWGMGERSVILTLENLATGRPARKWALPEYGFVAFAPDGRTVAVVGHGMKSDKERLLYLQDVTTGGERQVPLPPQRRGASVGFSPDGRTIAWGTVDGQVYLWETASEKVRARLEGHRDRVMGLAFSPDGRTLATGSDDTTGLLWDVLAPAVGGGQKLTPAQLREAWAALADADGAKAFAAVGTLATHPDESVPFLRGEMREAPKSDTARRDRLIADLDNDAFAVREAASRELGRMGESAADALRSALERGPSPEVRRRVQALLEKQQRHDLPPEQLRQVRAVEVLEYAGSEGAKELLAELARGAPEARLTREAKASLARMERKAAAR